MARFEFFYISPEQCPQPPDRFEDFNLLLTGEEHHHLAKVLRHSPGDTIFVTAGDGRIFECTIVSIAREQSELRIKNIVHEQNEPSFHLTIAQAVPKLSRFEWFLEKAVEIGVHQIWPMQTEFTEAFFSEKKKQRWQKIMIAAMKQCGRSRLPHLAPIKTFEEILLACPRFHRCWIAHAPIPATAKSAVSSHRSDEANGLILIGPQGGFSENEIQKAITAGLQFLSLGPTRLRSETAGLVSAAIILNQNEKQ